MTTTTVHGITVALITEEEIGRAMDNIEADWPRGQYQQLKRYVKDTLHDCAVLAGHYEDAARMRAAATTCYCGKRAHADCVQATCLNGKSSSPSPIDHSNGSARHSGQSETASSVHAKAMHKLAASLICPPAADELEAHIAAARGIPARVKA